MPPISVLKSTFKLLIMGDMGLIIFFVRNCFQEARKLNGLDTDTFELDQLDFRSVAQTPYMEIDSIKNIYLYQHISGNFYSFSYLT